MAASTTTHLLPVNHAFIDRPGYFFFCKVCHILIQLMTVLLAPPKHTAGKPSSLPHCFFILVIIEEGQFIYQRINYNFIT
jgi:hypothetical protein